MIFYDEVRENWSMSFVSYAPSRTPLIPCSFAPLLPCSPVSLLLCSSAPLLPCFPAPYFPAPLPPLAAAARSLAPLFPSFSLLSLLVFLYLFCALNFIQSSDLFVCSICFQSLGYALDPEGERFADMKDLLRHYYKFNLPKCDVKLTGPYK